MSTPPSPRQAGWQPGHVPKLSYRKAMPQDEIEAMEQARARFHQPLGGAILDDATLSKQVKGISIREIREALPESRTSARPTANYNPNPTLMRSAKKKGSLLGGLFAKEPTMVALAQVQADLVMKHGAATPQAVPHVSSRKLPEHVPKVNSKWDGLPLNKSEDREEDEHEWSMSRRASTTDMPTGTRSRSRGPTSLTTKASQRPYARPHPSSNRGTDSVDGQYQRRHYSPPESSHSSLSGGCGESSQSRAASIKSQSLRSPSGTSLPDITYFFPTEHAKPMLTHVRLQRQSTPSSGAQSMSSGSSSRYDRDIGQHYSGPQAAVIPEYSSSPVATPREASPVTPAFSPEPMNRPLKAMNERDVMRASASLSTEQSKRMMPIDAFLAGEARLLELPDEQTSDFIESDLPFRRKNNMSIARVQPDIARRPDSSRQRLGLLATKVVGNDTLPWEAPTPLQISTSSKDASRLSKMRSKRFGLL